MIIAAIVLGVVVMPLLWVIFIPVNIKVDTARGLYEIKQAGTVTVSLHPGVAPLVRIRILGFRIDTHGKETAKRAGREKVKTRWPKRVKRSGTWIYLVKGIVKSFHFKRFICSIDFNDVVLNAQLFPIGYFASRGPVMFNINFEKKYLL